MKQALQIAIDYMNDRLEDHDCKYQRHPATEAERINILADIETVKEALAKQEQGEPVAYIRKDQLQKAAQSPLLCEVTPESRQDRIGIYTTPQQRTWVGLTDEEIDKAWRSVDYTVPWEQHRIDIARAIQAKLNELNT
jgi:hypothetical protein